jgi:hypothetical protein
VCQPLFRSFVLGKYGSLAAVNRAYATHLAAVENLRVPFGEALLVSYNLMGTGYAPVIEKAKDLSADDEKALAAAVEDFKKNGAY